MSSQKYGNNSYWCFIEDDWKGKEIAIWSSIRENEGTEEIIARASNKYDAKLIIDALLNYKIEGSEEFNKQELAFLEFVSTNCVEPYSTMASNAILWKDKEQYDSLKEQFPKIYK